MKTTQGIWWRIRIISVLLIAVLIASIVGCETFGPKYASMKNGIIPLSKEKGRIVFYRPRGIYDYGRQPDIILNDKKVGISRPGTIFFVDVDPGNYKVRVPAMLNTGETSIDILILPNETIYVKTSIGAKAIKGRTDVEVVKPERAITEINKLEFMAEPTK
ncbi:MAG: DUF2846 domain-containing protein [Syntrophales bacterium]